MGAFLGALGGVAEQYAKNRYRNSAVGQAVTGYRQSRKKAMGTPSMGQFPGAADGDYAGWLNQMSDQAGPPPDETPTVNPVPTTGDPREAIHGLANGTNNDEYGPAGIPGLDSFGQGQIVMKPTIARLAEHGQPEMVIPLNGKSGNKVDGMAMMQGMMPRSRYRNFGQR